MIKTNLVKYLVFAIAFLFLSCNSMDGDKTKTSDGNTDETEKVLEESFKLWTWVTADNDRTDDSFRDEFEKYANNGIDALLINTYGNPENLARLVPIAQEFNLEVHAWMFTVNRPGDKIAEQHPEWYAVSRDGKSCYDEPPYVGY